MTTTLDPNFPAAAAPQPAPGMSVSNPLIAPVPTGLQMGMAMIDGKHQVVATIITPTGSTTIFLPPDEARKWAGVFNQAATQASTGLIVSSGLPDWPARSGG